MRRRHALLLSVLLVGLASAACGGALETEQAPTPGASEQPESAPSNEGSTKGPSTDVGTGSAPSPTSCASNGARATGIADNHAARPHTVEDLPAADFARHSFTLTAAERSALAAGKPITKTTTSGGAREHTHAVTLGCK
ncbi:MAG: hypothetical protein KF819_37795 [Labilithrix sp.]|nr:hypothetical protein [Labilithrix sp.]